MKSIYMKYCIGRHQKGGNPPELSNDILHQIATSSLSYSTKKALRESSKLFYDNIDTSTLRTRSKIYEPLETDAKEFDKIQNDFDQIMDQLESKDPGQFLANVKLLEDRLLERFNNLIIKQEYPKSMFWQNGDVFKTKIGEVYRNEHKYMWNGKKLVPLDYEMDEYGCVPKEFALGLDKNINIKYTHWWEYTIDNNKYVPVKFTQEALNQIKNNRKSKIATNSILTCDLSQTKLNFYVKSNEKKNLMNLQSEVTTYFEFAPYDENGICFMGKDSEDYESDSD